MLIKTLKYNLQIEGVYLKTVKNTDFFVKGNQIQKVVNPGSANHIPHINQPNPNAISPQ